jgi:hypothetical protein
MLITRSTIYATSRAGTAYWGYSTGVIFRCNGVAFVVVFLWLMFCAGATWAFCRKYAFGE